MNIVPMNIFWCQRCQKVTRHLGLYCMECDLHKKSVRTTANATNELPEEENEN